MAKVIDPKTGLDLITSGRISQLEIEGKNVNFSLSIPSADAKDKGDLNFACIQAISEVYPEANVNVHFVSVNTHAVPDQGPLPHVKNIIAVASGKGGVGKSTVALNLALAIQATGAKVGLIDADLYGPSLPTMLGLQNAKPKVKTVYGKHKIEPLQSNGLHVISVGFIIEPEAAVVLRGPRLGGILKQFINDVVWPELDYMVIDLPPGTGDIHLTMVQTVPVTGALIVTTPQEVALADAIKASNMFRLPSVNVPILGVVENMSWFTPAELPDNKYYLFGNGGGKILAEKMETKELAQIPIVQSIRESGDRGLPAFLAGHLKVSEAFETLAVNTIKQIESRKANFEPTNIVKLNT